MHQGWTVSVAMPAYNEESCIESAVRDFLALPDVDEVLVVDNNSTDDTNALARAAGARVITEVTQGMAPHLGARSSTRPAISC
ncbi:MAG TPA: glycosyltransferase [Gemmatimonadaceae bacterium]